MDASIWIVYSIVWVVYWGYRLGRRRAGLSREAVSMVLSGDGALIGGWSLRRDTHSSR